MIGVDGGGTAVRVAVVEGGRLVHYGVGGPANPKAVGIEAAARSVREAFARAEVVLEADDVVFMGIAGLRSENDCLAFREALEGEGLKPSCLELTHDIRVAHAGALAGAEGIVVVAGTGSSCYGRAADGREARSGGWGWFIDDPGSGYWLGFRAMRAAVRAHDGRAEATALERAVREFLHLQDLSDLPNILYNPHFSRERVAELAPQVLDCAAAGDAVAQALVAEGLRELVLMAQAVADRLSLKNPLVALTGGLSHAQELYAEPFGRHLERHFPSARFTMPRFEPVTGAVLLAGATVGELLAEADLVSLDATIGQRERSIREAIRGLE